MQWTTQQTLLFSNNNEQKTGKYACFDFDGTLVCPKSNSKYIANTKDWKFKFDTVCHTLRTLNENKFQIVIFTNQAGIKLFGIDNWKTMIEHVISKINLNVSVYVATTYDLYRKPYPTMWTEFSRGENINNKSFYCGDACGRTTDFSDTDYKFALNCNLKFYTPEELFLKLKYIEQPKLTYFIDFSKYMAEQPVINKQEDRTLIIMVGNYSSGKTHYVNKFLIPIGFVCANDPRDIQQLMNQQKLIVVDDINLTKHNRQKYILLAQKNNYSCKCVIMTCPVGMAIHNARFKHFVSNGKCKLISDEIIGNFKDKFECPVLDEGFTEIIRQKFQIDTTTNLLKYLMFLF